MTLIEGGRSTVEVCDVSRGWLYVALEMVLRIDCGALVLRFGDLAMEFVVV